jgi:phosphate transport system substrate-binding protein
MPFLKIPGSLLGLAVMILSLAAAPTTLFAQAGVVTIDGSSTVYPIMRVAAEAFEEKAENGAKVSVAFSGTTGGFRKFMKGEIDIADASRPILKAEMEAAKANGISYIEIPIAYDALTIAVHPENTWADSIKVSELKKLWEAEAEGQIRKWNQIRPDWPDAEIRLYGAGADSGTFDYFSEVVVGKLGGLRRDYTGSEDDTVLVQGIEGDKYALGFIPYAYFFDAEDRLKALAIEWDYDAMRGREIRSSPPVKQGRKSRLLRPVCPTALPVRQCCFAGKAAGKGLPEFFSRGRRNLRSQGQLPAFVGDRLQDRDCGYRQAASRHSLRRGTGRWHCDARSLDQVAAMILVGYDLIGI